VEKDEGIIDDSPVKYLTWRSFILGLCVSMGGFIFGYSTGKLALHALSHGTGYPAQSVHGN
jgi:SP family sugar:H+ symporter-like MFS transporter